jgi:hypothetical protein
MYRIEHNLCRVHINEILGVEMPCFIVSSFLHINSVSSLVDVQLAQHNAHVSSTRLMIAPISTNPSTETMGRKSSVSNHS